MKNILSILIVSILLFGCSKDNDSTSNNTSSSILGTWKIMTVENIWGSGYIDPVSGMEVTVESGTDIFSSHDTLREYLVYRHDNTNSYHNYFITIDTVISQQEDYTYIKNGNEVTVYSDTSFLDPEGIIGGYYITTLTNSDLIFKWDNNFQWDNNNQDTTFFNNSQIVHTCIKSTLPSITTEPLNKKKPVSGYNSFLNRRENR